MEKLDQFSILESNLKKIKFLFLFLILISSLCQVFLINDFKDLYSLIFLILSNLIVLNYCFNIENLKNYPISTFSIIFTNFYSNCSALFFKSLFLEPVTGNLYNPNFTFFYLLIFNILIVVIHIFYKNLLFFNTLKKLIQKIFLFINLDKINNKEFLIFLGLFSLLIATISVTFFGSTIYSSNQFGPNIVGDILNATNVFFISPFIILFTTNIYNFKITKKNYFFIFISFILVIYLSLGLNARSAFFDILFVGILIYCFSFLIGANQIKVLRLNKIVFILIFSLLIGSYIDKFSDSYLDVRATRDITNPISNIKNHFKNFNNQKSNKVYEVTPDRIFDENYYQINILNRINIVKATDNILFSKKYLNKDQIDKILNYELNQILALVPNPVIKIFSNSFNKNDYLQFTITSKIYRSVDKFFKGGKSNGISFGIFFIYENIFFLTLFLLSVFLCFTLLDAFKYKNSYLIIFFVLIYSTSGSLINIISSGSLSDVIGTLIRSIPQSILFYFIIYKIFNKLRRI